MKSNKFNKRTMVWALVAALLLGITPAAMPLTAQAAQAGAFEITGGTYTYEDSTLTITSNGTYTIAMSAAGSTTTDRIVVESGLTNVNITLDGVKIDRSSFSGSPAFDMTGATVNLTLAGENELKSGREAAGLNVPDSSVLTISENSSGRLRAIGGVHAAGIGGGYAGAGGSVTINSGTVTANGGDNGAGIGGGTSGAGGSVAINGGTVTATSGYNGAGIGGGVSGAGGNATINGGTVTANGGDNGAGIGGGYTGAGGNVTINGGTVTAIGKNGGAGIGGGKNSGAVGNVIINGGSVNRYGAASLEAQATRGGADLYPVTLTVGTSAVTNAAVTAGSIGGVECVAQTPTGGEYGIKDVKTDKDGKLYFYLPEGENVSVSMMVNGMDYSNNTVTITATDDNAATLIQVSDVLQFSNQPKAVTEVLFGEIYGSITALAVGPSDTVISYQWYVCEDANGKGGKQVPGANSSVFAIPTDLEVGTYYYYCMASAYGLTPATSSIAAVRVALEGKPWKEAGDFLVQTESTYKYNNTDHILEIYQKGDYKVKLKENITRTTNSIDILGNGITVNLTLEGVKIDRSSNEGKTAMWVNDNNKLNLTLVGENELKSGSGCSGLQAGSTRTIVITANSTGSLTAIGGSNGAGIGGDKDRPVGGDITIDGGTIIANGGSNAAGIGGANNGVGGILTINGGNVWRNGSQTLEAAPKNGAGKPVYLTTLTVGDPAVLKSHITAGKINDVLCAVTPDAQNGIYGINGVKTDTDGKLHFWLPEGENIPVLVTANDKVYAGDISPNTNNNAMATLLVKKLTVIVNGKSFTFDCSLEGEALVIAAYLDDKLVGLKTPEIKQNEDTVVDIASGGEAGTVKVMLWNSLESMRPLCKAKMLEYDGTWTVVTTN